MKEDDKKSIYYIYMLLCENDILYTGVTTDYKRRFAEHSKINNSKKGAKFTKSHKPVKIVALWETDTRSNAQKLEARIKKLEKSDKVSLIKNNKKFKVFFNDTIDISNYLRRRIKTKSNVES